NVCKVPCPPVTIGTGSRCRNGFNSTTSGRPMANPNRQRSVRLAVESLEGRDVPSGLPVGTLANQTFSGLTVGTLPLHWSQWSNQGSFAVSNDTALGPTRALSTLGASGQSARTWLNTSQPPNIQISTDLFLNAITPAGILARGSNLNGDTPSYYAVTAS